MFKWGRIDYLDTACASIVCVHLCMSMYVTECLTHILIIKLLNGLRCIFKAINQLLPQTVLCHSCSACSLWGVSCHVPGESSRHALLLPEISRMFWILWLTDFLNSWEDPSLPSHRISVLHVPNGSVTNMILAAKRKKKFFGSSFNMNKNGRS